jgi:glycyl-tRNA synthetase
MTMTIDDMASFCKRKGFVYQNSEIYGGMSGFFDYGPLGAEVKNSIKQNWWKFFIHQREDCIGLDGSIISHPTVWKASGHVDCFEDIMLVCSKCKEKIRGDTYIEDVLKIAADGMKVDEINKLVKEHELKCPKCKADFEEANDFNLMFKTQVGPSQDSKATAYLRPETAQLIFTNFRLATDNMRMKLPFGIAQIGKAFRNEISPRNFVFRCREFEQMEIEYFIHPKGLNDCPYFEDVKNHVIVYYSACMQADKKDMKKATIGSLVADGVIKTTWHGYWLAMAHRWYISLGARPENFRIRQHLNTEKSHYALDTWDLEYNFPFGWKELIGMANRTDYDLSQHIKFSKKDLSLFDEETKEKVVPHVVAEPSFGVDRSFLIFMFDAYEDDKERGNIVLKLHPKLAPIKASVFPLVNKEGLPQLAKKIYKELQMDFNVTYDQSGSIGRRYARADEIGTPICITVDFDSKEENTVTIRDRDTTKQERVKIEDLKAILEKKMR